MNYYPSQKFNEFQTFRFKPVETRTITDIVKSIGSNAKGTHVISILLIKFSLPMILLDTNLIVFSY